MRLFNKKNQKNDNALSKNGEEATLLGLGAFLSINPEQTQAVGEGAIGLFPRIIDAVKENVANAVEAVTDFINDLFSM